MLYKKDDPSQRYRQVFSQGEAQGFKVTDVHYKLHPTHSGDKKEMVYVEMDTPYTYAGEAVTALAVIDPSIGQEKVGAIPYSGEDRIPYCRQYQDCMLMLASNGKNLEDVSERENGTRAFVVMKGTEPMAGMKALDEMGQFAAAASHYPSVIDFEDYKVLTARNWEKTGAAKLGWERPSPAEGYVKYLNNCIKLAADPHMRYVGKATTPRQIESLLNDFEQGRDFPQEEVQAESGMEMP